MMNLESLEAVHTHTHTHTIHSTKKNGNYLLDETQFSKIDIRANKGMVFAFICDRLKDRNKAIVSLDFYVLHRNLSWKKQRASKSLFVQMA